MRWSQVLHCKSAIEEQKVKVILAKLMGKAWPSFTLSNGLDPATLSRDQTVVQNYIEDPLVHHQISAGLGLASLDAIALAKQSAPVFPIPVLVMHGGADKLSYPAGSIDWAARAPKDKCTLKIWRVFFTRSIMNRSKFKSLSMRSTGSIKH